MRSRRPGSRRRWRTHAKRRPATSGSPPSRATYRWNWTCPSPWLRDYDRNSVVELLRELEFHSVIARLPGDDAAEGQARMFEEDTGPDADYRVVDTEEALAAMVAELDSPSGFSFDTETTATDPMAADLVGLSFSNAAGVAWYVPVGHREGRQLPQDRVLAALKPLFESEDVPKAAHNANYDVTVLANHGVQVRNLQFDTMLAAHFAGRQAIGLKALALDQFHVEMTPITDLLGRGRKQLTMDQVEIERAAPYAAADADFTERLRGEFERELEDGGLSEAFHKVEMPLAPVLVRMQRNGVALDSETLERMSVELGERLRGIAADMYETVGHEFNINSSQQLGDVLFKELRLPTTKRTKTGFSTDAASLDSLKEQLDLGVAVDADPRAYAVLGNVLDYRQLSKLKSTYVDTLPSLVNERTGRIHTKYNQTGSATGRISSSDPNVQNIPVRTELGRQVRSAFVAEGAPDWTLLAADYSQIELRILADLSEDDSLLAAFRNGEDIHASTAAAVYGVGLDDVNAEMRRVRQDNELRRHLRTQPVRHSPADRLLGRGWRPLHRDLLRQVSGHPRLHRPHQGRGQVQGLRRNEAGPAPLHPRGARQEPQRSGGGRANGHKHAHPGNRRGHHQDRHDRHPEPVGRAGHGHKDDPPGPRRAHIRGPRRRARAAQGPSHGADARRHDASGTLGRGAQDRLQMGRNGVSRGRLKTIEEVATCKN